MTSFRRSDLLLVAGAVWGAAIVVWWVRDMWQLIREGA